MAISIRPWPWRRRGARTRPGRPMKAFSSMRPRRLRNRSSRPEQSRHVMKHISPIEDHCYISALQQPGFGMPICASKLQINLITSFPSSIPNCFQGGPQFLGHPYGYESGGAPGAPRPGPPGPETQVFNTREVGGQNEFHAALAQQTTPAGRGPKWRRGRRNAFPGRIKKGWVRAGSGRTCKYFGC
jgi:hypothetical protein